jgi:phosphotransferase system HPr (HPr) family protein
MSETKEIRTVVVTDPAGVHARTAVDIANVARAGKSQVTLFKDNRPVTATDVLQILTMVAHQHETIRLEAVGPDAEAVLDALEPLFAERPGESDQPTA